MDMEGSKFRLVRCPKCENLLPELHEFSLYKCGGCGAVLQANKQGSRSDDDLLEKSDEEKGEGVSVKEKLICQKTVSSIDSSPSKAQDKVFVKPVNQSSRVETMDLQHKQNTQKRDAVNFDGRYNPYSRGRFDNRVQDNGQALNATCKLSTFSNLHEGSSNNRSSFPHDFGVNKRVENLEHDRAELLRKIDELKIQLGSSIDMRQKPVMIDSRLNRHNSYVPEGPCRANFQPFGTDQNVLDPNYRDYKNGYALNTGNIYPPNRAVRSSYQQPYHDQFSGHNLGINQKHIASQNCVGSLHRPQCSCFQCYREVQPTNQQAYLRSTNHPRSSGSYGLHAHNFVSPGSLNGGLLTRGVIAHGNKNVCHPKTGGAPFLACPSCFVLLNFPNSFTNAVKNGKKIRCGACSVLISVDFEKNGMVIRIPTKPKQVSTEGHVGYGEAFLQNVKILDDDLEAHECDNSTINPHSINVETNALSRDHSVKSARSSERQGPVSLYSSLSENELSPDSVIIVREKSKSADLALKDDLLQPDDDYEDFVHSRCGMGNKSKRASRQNSVKDVLMVTDNGVVYSDGAVSEEVEKEGDEPRMEEERESFLGGLFKKGFKDLLRPSRNGEMSRINVFVNGQPLPNRVVKKAEKLAGPIQPGNYWYDYRAGFWGVMGQPCHGIIPPFIEEFNYAMPTKCGDGNTGVFVNGRELHESDLELLACRGLPTTKDKFYMIEISGRVVNEYTAEELDLGKLAPTVEKVKHGFGMRPRAVAETAE